MKLIVAIFIVYCIPVFGQPVVVRSPNQKVTVSMTCTGARTNFANEITVYLENEAKAKLQVIIRAYNDGIAFRYQFPDEQGSDVMKDELTAYHIPKETKRWMEQMANTIKILKPVTPW